MRRQSGFTLIEIILVVALVVLVGFVSWRAWQAQQRPAKPVAPAKPTATRTAVPTPTPAPSSLPRTAYTKTSPSIAIPEMGVRLAFDDADKVTYKIGADGYGGTWAGLYLKSNLTTSEKCQNLGVALNRLADNSRGGVKVGSYYYFMAGSPISCSDDPNHPDQIDQLRLRIISQELGDNQYSVTALR